MASTRKEILLDTSAEQVWSALRDFYAVHKRVAPGFLTACKPEEGARVLTFANGSVFRELLVDCDDARHRLAYAIADKPLTTYSASVQVFPESSTRCRLVWIVDMLPNELAGHIASQMDAAVRVMKPTL